MDAVPGMERHVAFTIRQPVGVVAAIVPFNYPVELYAHKAAAALAAGNAVIGKPPSDCPLAVLRIARDPRGGRSARRRPPGADRSGVAHRAAAGARSRAWTWSRSRAASRRASQLGRIAAEHHKPFLAELGGNDAGHRVRRRRPGAGRRGRRAGPPRPRQRPDLLCREARPRRRGGPRRVRGDPGPHGPGAAGRRRTGRAQRRRTARSRSRRRSRSRGSSTRPSQTAPRCSPEALVAAAFIQPTVLTDVPPTAPTVVREETFGPVVPLRRVRDHRRRRGHGQRLALRPPGGGVHAGHRERHGRRVPAGGGRRDGQLVVRAARREPALRRRQAERPRARGAARHAPGHDAPEGDPAARGAAAAPARGLPSPDDRARPRWRCAASTSATTRRRCCTRWTSRRGAARSTPWSARTARASRP